MLEYQCTAGLAFNYYPSCTQEANSLDRVSQTSSRHIVYHNYLLLRLDIIFKIRLIYNWTGYHLQQVILHRKCVKICDADL